MKKTVFLLITLVVTFAVCAGAQSVVDVAKQARAKQKSNPNARVIDNDVIPSNLDASASPAPADPASASAAASSSTNTKSAAASNSADAKDAAKDDKAGSEKAPSAGDDKKNTDAWKKQINDQKKEIGQLERELNVA